MKPVCWKRMSSGKYIDLNNLTEDDLDIDDIVTALSWTYRFNGHHKDMRPLTVAEHSLLCYQLAYDHRESREVQLAVLTHDFAEAYIGDVSTPMKKAMGDLYHDFATPIERLVSRKFYGGVPSPDVEERVKLYDLAALDIERRVMWTSQAGKDKWPPSPLNVGTIEDKAEYYYMQYWINWDLKTIWKELYESLHTKQPE